MRIDQFLWFSRIYKTRTSAGNACKKGHIKIDSKTLKPSFEVYPNLTISVKKNQILYKYKIKDLPKSRVGAKIVELYVKNITPKSELIKIEIIKSQKKNYKFDRKLSKKDKRDINKYLNE
tara:strand:+ start:9202 stop:9561 length:360 start_codon:yes stop_codon:yes gene_type:complete